MVNYLSYLLKRGTINHSLLWRSVKNYNATEEIIIEMTRSYLWCLNEG